MKREIAHRLHVMDHDVVQHADVGSWRPNPATWLALAAAAGAALGTVIRWWTHS